MVGSSIRRFYFRVGIIGVWSILVGGVCLFIWTQLTAAFSPPTTESGGAPSPTTDRVTSFPSFSLASLVAPLLAGFYQVGVLGIMMGVGLMLVGVYLIKFTNPSRSTAKRL